MPLDAPGAYTVIEPTERFDLIFSNPPWEDAQPAALSENALYDPGFQLLDSMMRDLRRHLAPGGKALLAYGSVAGIERLQELAPQYGFTTRVHDDRDLLQLPAVFVPAVVIEVVPAPEDQNK